MAIIVQEEKQSGLGILYILIWLVLIIGILVGLYYVFFKKPELYESIVPLNKSNINDIISIKSSIDLNAVMLMTQSLKNYIDIPSNIPSGKENPFF
ncbi:MAG: hypothetical protein ACPL3E_02220 [Minisyncoccia bacterium]